MRKKLKVSSERIRNLTAAERAAIIGGQNVEEQCSGGKIKDSCIIDPPPRFGGER